MPWRVVSEDEVLEELTPQEAAALKNIQGDDDKLPGVMSRVVEQIRGSILAGGFEMGGDGTVPSQLVTALIDIAIWRWLKSFPTLKAFQTKDRKDAYDAAVERLKGVSKKEEAIEAPDVAEAVYPQASVEASANRRRADRCRLDGI